MCSVGIGVGCLLVQLTLSFFIVPWVSWFTCLKVSLRKFGVHGGVVFCKLA